MLTLSKRAEQLARLAANRSGGSPELIVEHALERQLASSSLILARRPVASAERVAAILETASKLPVIDDRSADEIIGYDEAGVPK